MAARLSAVEQFPQPSHQLRRGRLFGNPTQTSRQVPLHNAGGNIGHVDVPHLLQPHRVMHNLLIQTFIRFHNRMQQRINGAQPVRRLYGDKPVGQIPHIAIAHNIRPEILVPCAVKVFTENIFDQIDRIFVGALQLLQAKHIDPVVRKRRFQHIHNFPDRRHRKPFLHHRQIFFLWPAPTLIIRKNGLVRKGKNTVFLIQSGISHRIALVGNRVLRQPQHMPVRLIRIMPLIDNASALIIGVPLGNAAPPPWNRRNLLRQRHLVKLHAPLIQNGHPVRLQYKFCPLQLPSLPFCLSSTGNTNLRIRKFHFAGNKLDQFFSALSKTE